jgi:peptidase M23
MVPSWLLAANRRRSSALAGLCIAALALPTLANAAPEQSVENERTWVGTQIGSTIAKDRFCDVNGDSRNYGHTIPGKQDIVTASPSGLVTVIPGGNPGGKMPVAGTSSFKIPASPDVSVSCVLDVDHDSKDEILVSSSTAGKAWLIYGRTDFSDVDYTKLSEKGQGFTITGTPGTTHFSAVFAGKYDGDYRSDIVVLNPEGNYSVAYLLNADSRSDKDLNDYTTSNQKLYSPEGMFFDSVQPVGNVDGSGHTDYVFTTSDANGKHGKAWLVTNIGTSSFLNDPFAGIPEINLEENTYLGKATTAANAGDVNGDGYDDTLIGFNGGVALLYGASTLPNTYTINSANQTDPNVAVLTGTGSGWSVASYAREGKPNLVAVGAPHAGDGEVYYFPTTAFTAGSHPISGLGDQVTTIKAKQPGTRFGISVAFSGAWPTETPILVAGADNATKETPASAADFGPNAYIQAMYLGPAATPTPVPTQTAPAAPTQEPTAEPTREPTAAPTQEPTAIAIPQEPRTPLAPLPVVPAKPSPLPAPVDAGVLVTDKLPSANAKVKTGAVHSSKLAITGLDAASGLVALALLTTGAGALVLRSRRSA